MFFEARNIAENEALESEIHGLMAELARLERVDVKMQDRHVEQLQASQSGWKPLGALLPEETWKPLPRGFPIGAEGNKLLTTPRQRRHAREDARAARDSVALGPPTE